MIFCWVLLILFLKVAFYWLMGLQCWQAGGQSVPSEEAVENSKREMFWLCSSPFDTQITKHSTAEMHINICIGLDIEKKYKKFYNGHLWQCEQSIRTNLFSLVPCFLLWATSCFIIYVTYLQFLIALSNHLRKKKKKRLLLFILYVFDQGSQFIQFPFHLLLNS